MVADSGATIQAVWSSWVVARAVVETRCWRACSSTWREAPILDAQHSKSALKAERSAVVAEPADAPETGGSSSTGPSLIEMTGGIANPVTWVGGAIGGAEGSLAVSPHIEEST